MTTARYRNTLPQLGGDLFLADGGIETTLIFHDGLELPDFAAFHLLRTTKGPRHCAGSTDPRHIEQMAEACAPLWPAKAAPRA